MGSTRRRFTPAYKQDAVALIADGGHRGADEFDEPAHSDFGMLHDTQITPGRPKQAGLRLPDYKNMASGVAIGDRAALWLKEAAAPGSWPLQLDIPNSRPLMRPDPET